jgi:hypothetical protein
MVALSLAISLIQIGCARDPKPSTSEIEQSLTTRLPAFARVTSFSMEAMENIGTRVEPIWHSRFRTTIKVSAPTFLSDGTDHGAVFVRPVKREGETMEVFGKAASTLYAGSWRTSVSFEGSPIDALGQPASAFGSGKLIVRGTAEETAYLAEQAERERQAIIENERRAETERAEAEQARVQQALALEHAKQAAENTRREMVQGLESSDCSSKQYDVPPHSEVAFVVNAKRKCWTPWLAASADYFSVRLKREHSRGVRSEGWIDDSL